MEISYITSYDATDIKNWSGTAYYIPIKLAEKGYNIDYVGDLSIPALFYYKLKEKFYQKMQHKIYYFERSPYVLKSWANQIEKRIKSASKVLLSPSSQPFSLLETDKPKVFWTDACFADMIDFYPAYSNMAKETIKHGNAMEKAALENCTLAVYSSEWAANGAINNYNISPEKVKVVNYGANIDTNLDLDDIIHLVGKKSKETCNLLFLGVHWYRKGGDIALEVAKYLNKSGLKTTLSIVGCKPEVDDLPNYVRSYGFVSKGSDDGKKLLSKLISESHFLLLPTRADCTPIVYAEFNAYGIPAITTNVGGIPSLVKDNINGKKFDLNTPSKKYGQFILDLFAEYDNYIKLCVSSYNEYKNRLNWDVSIEKFNQLLHTIV